MPALSSPPSAPRGRVLLAFACVYLFWGSTYLAMRMGVEVLPPFVLASVRYLISGSLMLLFCAARGLRIQPTSTREFWTLGLVGVLMLIGGNTTVIWAEQWLPTGLAALLVASIPLYAALIEVARPQGDGLSMQGWIGIAVGFAGIVFLLWPKLRLGIIGDSSQIIAAAVVLVGTFSWTLASVIQRRTTLGIGGFAAAGWQMSFAGVGNTLLLLGTRGWHGAHWACRPGQRSPGWSSAAPSSPTPPTSTCWTTSPSPRSRPTPTSTRSSPSSSAQSSSTSVWLAWSGSEWWESCSQSF